KTRTTSVMRPATSRGSMEPPVWNGTECRPSGCHPRTRETTIICLDGPGGRSGPPTGGREWLEHAAHPRSSGQLPRSRHKWHSTRARITHVSRGQRSRPFPGRGLVGSVSCDGTLCGRSLYLQALEMDPAASKGLSFTQGLHLVLGS